MPVKPKVEPVAKPAKKSKTLETLRGFRDILPDEQAVWEKIEDVARGLTHAYGFGRVRLPALEGTSVFERGVGKDTDIVEKEMFTFVDQGGVKMTLRPEGTAQIARAYIEHGMLNQPQPVKLWYLEQFFRHERPQAGRYRQFWQLGFEALGSDDAVLDAQIVIMAYNFCKDLGVETMVNINSLGTPAIRKTYVADLSKYFKGFSKKLSETDLKRLQRNPLRLLDSKEEGMEEIKAGAPQLIEYLDEENKQHFMKVLEYLDEAEVPYTLNPFLVRGLDYYTKTVFELMSANPIGDNGSQLALGGGGRYDGLVPLFGGREATGAVGAALGMERVILAMKAAGSLPDSKRVADVFFCQLGDAARRKGLKIFEKFRQADVDVAEAFAKGNLKGQLEIADKMKAQLAVILGQKEVLDGTIILRDMESGAQEIVDVTKVVGIVVKRLADLKIKPKKTE
ncbi:MAG: histidine--tRNA ligase [Patescibacteria group bacterium]